MTGRVRIQTQELILTLARRRWTVLAIARALSMDRHTVARCLDGWGVERARRSEG